MPLLSKDVPLERAAWTKALHAIKRAVAKRRLEAESFLVSKIEDHNHSVLDEENAQAERAPSVAKDAEKRKALLQGAEFGFVCSECFAAGRYPAILDHFSCGPLIGCRAAAGKGAYENLLFHDHTSQRLIEIATTKYLNQFDSEGDSDVDAELSE